MEWQALRWRASRRRGDRPGFGDGGHQPPDRMEAVRESGMRRRRGRGGAAAIAVACFGLLLLDGRGAEGATSCYQQVQGRQGSSLRFDNPFTAYPVSVCQANTSQVCDIASVPQSAPTTPLLFANSYPGAPGPRADCGLFCQELTAELVVKMEDTRIFETAVPKTITLIGNMLRANAAASGWRISCRAAQCCFQAYIGNTWREGSAYNPVARQLAPMREVCTPVGVVEQGKWFHIAATYSGATGEAKLFVDGAKRAEAMFPASGDLATGTVTSREVNYDYFFAANPWWATAPDPRCALGQTSACTRLAALRIGGQESVDHLGAGFAGGEVTVFAGHLDEVRVWVGVRSDVTIEEASFEILEKSEVPPCALERLAGSTDIQALALHLHDPNAGEANPGATSIGNEVAVGVDTVQTRAPGTVVVEVLTEKYMDRPVVFELSRNSSRGVLAEYPAVAGVRNQTFVVDQNQLMVLDLRIRDPNFRDRTLIKKALYFSTRLKAFGGDPSNTTDEGDVCYINNGRPFTLECNDADPIGWAAYTGPASGDGTVYGGPGTQLNTPGWIPLETNWCVGTDSRPNIDASIEEFAPPLGARNVITYRVVWKPRRDLEWWTPNGGWEVTFGYENTGVYDSPAVTTADHAFVFTVANSPEFLDLRTYPKFLAVDDGLQNVTDSQLAIDAAGSPAPDEVYVCGVGKAIEFSVRARDRNVEDVIAIGVRQEFGLPPGVEDGSVVLEGVRRTDPSTKLGVCVIGDLMQTAIPPPYNFERPFTFRPKLEHVGGVYKSCFYAVSAPNASLHALGFVPLSPESPDASARQSLRDRCVIMKVVAPEPEFVIPERPTDIITARVGCKTSLTISVMDKSIENAHGDTSSDPYTLVVAPAVERSEACMAINCTKLPGGLPEGAVLSELSVTANRSDYLLEWTPVRGQELSRPYRVCLTARDVDDYGNATVCYSIKVRKCQYCLQAGETLQSVAHTYKIDYLELYLSNPSLTTPDRLNPGTVITTGSIYDVRPGDYLELLEERFLTPRSSLLANNPDLTEDEGFALGYPAQMCVVAPTCRVRCLYGTECRLVEQKLPI